jgi:hypothetical protein
MMASCLRRILKLGPLMGEFIVSATGCFAFMRDFRVVAMGQRRPDARSPVRIRGRFTMHFAGIGAALFLLAFIASEAAATIVALRH